MNDISSNRIPIVDVSPLIRRAPGGMEFVGRKIAEACETIGFFYAVGHGVPPETIANAFAASKRFFALPEATRMAIKVDRFSRGYLPLRHITHPGHIPDLKESFDIGIDVPEDDPDVQAGKLHGPNQWPAMDDFRAPVENYFETVRSFGFNLLPGFAAALGMPHNFFQELYQPRPIALMRLIRYPRRSSAPAPGQLAAAAHTDYGMMTILAQDSTGGLELKPRGQDWFPAPCIPGSFIINLGDLLAQWTNDRFMSMPHRVVQNADKDRLSIALFYHPHFDAVADCLPTCRSPDNPAKYPSVTFGKYILGKYDKIFAHKHGAKTAAA